ncbi:MAG: hypothetical protein A2289_13200, partial [Deltaproteobacteria bacterium RIFOXYA12_FULL_58_15]
MSSSLRILHVTPYYEQAWSYGGIPRVVTALSRAQMVAGHQVSVWTTDVATSSTRARRTVGGFSHGVRVAVSRNLSNTLAFHQQLFVPMTGWRTLHEFVVANQIIHIHGHRHLPGAAAALMCRRHGLPYVVQPNGTATLIERRLWRKRFVDSLGARNVLQSAALCLAVSQWELERLVELGLSRSKLTVVANPVFLEDTTGKDLSGFLPAPNGEEVRLVYLGQATPRKNLDTLIRALALVKRPARLFLAGPEGRAATELLRLAQRHSVAKRLVMLGVVSGDQRRRLLSDCDIACYVTRDEAFGLVPFEAILCGTPVLVGADAGS